MEFRQYRNNMSGSPQGSVISPILANIFMDQLDQMVAGLKAEFDVGKCSRRTAIATSLIGKIRYAKLKGNMEKVVTLTKERARHPAVDFSDPGFKQLAYIRYADD